MIYLYAFLIGGALCAAAQIIIDLTAVTPARVLVGYVCVGVLLTGLGLYDSLVRAAGRPLRSPASATVLRMECGARWTSADLSVRLPEV